MKSNNNYSTNQLNESYSKIYANTQNTALNNKKPIPAYPQNPIQTDRLEITKQQNQQTESDKKKSSMGKMLTIGAAILATAAAIKCHKSIGSVFKKFKPEPCFIVKKEGKNITNTIDNMAEETKELTENLQATTGEIPKPKSIINDLEEINIPITETKPINNPALNDVVDQKTILTQDDDILPYWMKNEDFNENPINISPNWRKINLSDVQSTELEREFFIQHPDTLKKLISRSSVKELNPTQIQDITYYHGTTAENLQNIKKNGFNIENLKTAQEEGKGIYLASNKQDAEAYGVLGEFKLSKIKRILEVDHKEYTSFLGKLKHDLRPISDRLFGTDINTFDKEFGNEIIRKALLRQGLDAVKIVNATGKYDMQEFIVVLDPTKIISI